MSTPIRRTATAAAAIALTASLAACNNGSGPGGDLSYEDSPLYKYMDVLNSGYEERSEEEWQLEHEERERQREDLVAQCMAEQGFEYNPESNSGGFSFTWGGDDYDGPEYGSVEFAQQWGYQVFTWDEMMESQGYDPNEGADYVDPNQDIRDAMSESEQEAWEEALWGPPNYEEWDPDAEWDDSSWEWNWEDQGCYGWAQHEVDGDYEEDPTYQLYEEPRFKELFESMGRIYEQAESSTEMSELNSKWSSCMADEGYTYSVPWDAQESIYELQNSMYEDVVDWENFDGPDPALVEQYKQQEIDTAVADYGCRAEVKFDDESMRIQFKYEEEFINNNKAALDEFLAAAQELQK